jgi:hypothetical protein
MAVTTYKNITKLEVGQKEKEATINTGLDVIDAELSRLNDEVVSNDGELSTLNGSIGDKIEHLGELASDPVTFDVPPGSTYYNTTTSKLKFLRQDGTTWTNVA